jgi:hypothetical protein
MFPSSKTGFTSISLSTPLDTYDALGANALSENGRVRLNGRGPDFLRGLLSRRNLLWFSGTRVSPDASIVLRLALPEESLSADLVSLADAPQQLRIAMAAGFVDIGRQLGDTIVELDEFRASTTLGSRCEERPLPG